MKFNLTQINFLTFVLLFSIRFWPETFASYKIII